MDRQFPSRPYVGVGVIVWRGDELLLVQRGRAPRKGQWGLPGGVQELGETVFAAARREVREETGVDIRPVAVIDVVDGIDRAPDGRVRYHYTLIEVVAEWVAGEAVAADDAAAAVWTRREQLARFAVWHETKRVIDLAAARRDGADRAKDQ